MARNVWGADNVAKESWAGCIERVASFAAVTAAALTEALLQLHFIVAPAYVEGAFHVLIGP